MARKSKDKTGINGDLVFARKHNRTNTEIEGRERKKQKKRKGLKSGSRHSSAEAEQRLRAHEARDPRLGSKKKIPLIAEEKQKPTKAQRRVSAQQELEMLENDAQLNVLLDRLDNGEKLGVGLQKYVDEKLDRMEVLMKQLGLYDEEMEASEDDEPQPQSRESVKGNQRKAESDDDLLSQFEDLDMNQFKE